MSPLQRIGWGALTVLTAFSIITGIGQLLAWRSSSDQSSGGNFEQTINNPLVEKSLYVDPTSNAARQAAIWQVNEPDKAKAMYKLAAQPSSRWYSGAITYDEVHDYVQAANDAGKLPVTVAYYIPERDCNKYSSGGAPNQEAYYDYINTYASAIGNLNAVVILEPDAVAHMLSKNTTGQSCLGNAEQEMYTTLLSYAVDRFKSLPETVVYIDAGNSGWSNDAQAIAALLRSVGVDQADGFSLNVSNFRTNDETIRLGDAISRQTDGKHYVIDTSRNGLGPYSNPTNPDFNWCNPPGRSLGHYPTVSSGEARVDAFLFIKNAGESDGSDPDPNKCHSGPPAGQWWPDYALGLVQRWPNELQYRNRQ